MSSEIDEPFSFTKRKVCPSHFASVFKNIMALLHSPICSLHIPVKMLASAIELEWCRLGGPWSKKSLGQEATGFEKSMAESDMRTSS